MKVKQEFFGFNPIMWMGVVEDNDDPIKLGRLKVRIFGWHTGETGASSKPAAPSASKGKASGGDRQGGNGGNVVSDPAVGINDTKYAEAYFNNFGIDVNDPATYPPNQVGESDRSSRGFPVVGKGMEELLERTPMSQIPEYANGKGGGGGGGGGSAGGAASGGAVGGDGEEVKVEDLPWAQVMQPVNASPNSGTGQSITGIQKGTWVMGMFLDGEIAREPMVMGCIGGMPQHESLGPEEGFYDPDKKFPRDGVSWTYKEKEPDTNRLARNDNVQVHGDDKDYEHNIINRKKQNQMKTKGSILGFDIDEPVIESWSKFKSKYPDNKVWETKMGHIFEVDDTAGFERIHIYHQNGTYINIDNGDQENKGPQLPRRIDKVTGDMYTFIQRNDYRIVPEGDMRSLSRHYSHIAEGAYRIDAKSITIKGHTQIVGSLDVDRLTVGTGLTDTIVDINGITYGFEKGILTHRGI